MDHPDRSVRGPVVAAALPASAPRALRRCRAGAFCTKRLHLPSAASGVAVFAATGRRVARRRARRAATVREEAQGAAPAELSHATRVVAISDTHGFHRRFPRLPEGDLLIHCGDAQGNSGSDLADFVEWFRQQDFKHKIFVRGNHEKGREWKDRLGAVYLRGATHCGKLKLFGIPYQPDGFMQMAYSKQIPEQLDLLVTHEPPHKMLDYAWASSRSLCSPTTSPPMEGFRQEHIGSKTLKSALGRLAHKSRINKRRLSPRVHLFGHVHEGRGKLEKNGTLFLNVSNANPGMARTLQHPCVVLDIATDGSGDVRVVSM
ncbi:unnamed protein product [Durusdinium trenchii]|uniref:Calcineurin-like phosphoesterase domain-containing protein n=1 Tax=Durusdinium trenchii TaxID=1381693 RepID=A0ABP0PPC6_9DINO